jgi:hypothetical protein
VRVSIFLHGQKILVRRGKDKQGARGDEYEERGIVDGVFIYILAFQYCIKNNFKM